MSEHRDAALRRQSLMRVLGLVAVGTGRCPGCHQRAEVFARRQATPGEAKERCLDGWSSAR